MNKIINIDSNILRYTNILAIPSIHSRVYFSLAVREAVKEFKPDAIAIEHPESFNKSFSSKNKYFYDRHHNKTIFESNLKIFQSFSFNQI